MSGRKAGEVSALLKQGAQTRQAGEANFDRNLRDFLKTLPNNEREFYNIYDELQNALCRFSSEAETECKDECGQLKKRLTSLQHSLHKESFDTAFAQNKAAEYRQQFVALDARAERIYQAIRGRHDYCDGEYRQAGALLQEYKDLTRRQSGEESAFKMKIADSNQALSRAKVCKQQLEEIMNAAEALNKKAHDVVLLRNKASEAKAFIRSLLETVEKPIAEKFMPDEYRAALAAEETYLQGDDAAIVAGFNAIQNNLSLFKQQLAERFAAFQAEKKAAESAFSETYELLTKDTFYNPLDYAKKQDAAEAVHLFDFLNTYAAGEFVADIDGYFKQAKEALTAERFADVHTLLGSVTPLITEAAAKAALVQEEKLRSIYNMVNLRDALVSLNYKVKMEMQGDSITVTATAGDEVISMEAEAGGNLKIDHHESVSGGCAATWQEIQKACKDHDFLLQDVKKDGKSVIYGNTAQTSSAATQEGVRSR